MKKDDTVLIQQIENARKMSPDNSLVSYDLTSGVDFSHPRKTAEALAAVFFQKDAINWFKVKEDDLEFTPKYKGKIVLTSENHHKVKETTKNFISDLKSEEIDKFFSDQVEANAAPDDPSFLGSMTSFLSVWMWEHSQHHYRKKVYLEKIVKEIRDNLEVIES